MKRLFFVVIVSASLVACNTADKKAGEGPALTQEDKSKASRDSANYTEIQWLDSSFVDLGKVKEGQVVEVKYRFKNSGTKNLIIANVSASCGCTVPEKPEKPYAPGEEGVIRAKFDSKGRPHGEARKSVYVEANTPTRNYELSFRVEITD